MSDHDNKLLLQLSQQWQQTENKKPDLNALKRRLVINRVKMLSLTLVDVLIAAVMLYLFYKGYKDNYPVSFMTWIGFGLIFALVTTVISTIQRVKAWRIKDMNTKSWLIYEHRHSTGQLAYSKLLKYGVLVFGIFFHIWLIAGFVFDADFRLAMNLRGIFTYLFSIGWFGLFWWIANRIERKALIAMAYLDNEQQELNES